MNLIYINPGNSSVMESQVISLLDHYIERGCFQQVVLFQGYGNTKERTVLEKKLEKSILQVVWFNTYPNYSFFNREFN